MEYKSIPFEVKALNEDVTNGEWIVEGLASTYDVDLGNDQIEKGAFTKTIQERFTQQRSKNGKSKIKALWQHDVVDVIGSILELNETDEGLYCKIQLFKDPIFVSAQKAYRLARYGELDSFSIGYRPTRWEDVEDDDGHYIRVIKELKLYEISVVTFPMNEKAEFTNVKDGDIKSVNNEKAIQLLTEIKSVLEQFCEKQMEISNEVKELKEASCPKCEAVAAEVKTEASSETPEEVKSELTLEEVVNQMAAMKEDLKTSLTAYILENLAKAEPTVVEEVKEETTPEVVAEEVVEEKNELTEEGSEPTEVKLEDVLNFLLTKEFNFNNLEG